jgi:hypothetical protein
MDNLLIYHIASVRLMKPRYLLGHLSLQQRVHTTTPWPNYLLGHLSLQRWVHTNGYVLKGSTARWWPPVHNRRTCVHTPSEQTCLSL